MKKIGQFIVENPQRLGAQLSDLENNIAKETQDIRASFAPELEQVSFSVASPVTQQLGVGQVGLCDTSAGNVSLFLAPDPRHMPGFLAVIKTSGANAVTIFPSGNNRVGSRAQINAAANLFASGAARLMLFYFDGYEWWN